MSERYFEWTIEPELAASTGITGSAKIRMLSYPEKTKLRSDLQMAKLAKFYQNPADIPVEALDEINTLSARMYNLCAQYISDVDFKCGDIHIRSLDELLDYSVGETIFGNMVGIMTKGKLLPKR